jgi:hypothetical protein
MFAKNPNAWIRNLFIMRQRKGLIGFITVVQLVFFFGHYLLYKTWTAGIDTGLLWIKAVLGLLSVSFIAASLLAFRYTNAAVRAFYRAAAIWLGLLSFLFTAAVFSWIIVGVARLSASQAATVLCPHRPTRRESTPADLT